MPFVIIVTAGVEFGFIVGFVIGVVVGIVPRVTVGVSVGIITVIMRLGLIVYVFFDNIRFFVDSILVVVVSKTEVGVGGIGRLGIIVRRK